MTLGEWMDEEAAKEKEIGRAEGRAEGKIEGIAEAILDVLSLKGNISTDCSDRITAEENVSVLKTWLHLAVEVTSLEEFMEKM